MDALWWGDAFWCCAAVAAAVGRVCVCVCVCAIGERRVGAFKGIAGDDVEMGLFCWEKLGGLVSERRRMGGMGEWCRSRDSAGGKVGQGRRGESLREEQLARRPDHCSGLRCSPLRRGGCLAS